MAKDPYKSQGDSDSPQASRHGNKDVFDLGAGEVQKNAGEFDWSANSRQPIAPTDEWQEMIPPSETFPEPSGPPGDRSPTPPQEPGTASGKSDSQAADAAFKHLGK